MLSNTPKNHPCRPGKFFLNLPPREEPHSHDAILELVKAIVEKDGHPYEHHKLALILCESYLKINFQHYSGLLFDDLELFKILLTHAKFDDMAKALSDKQLTQLIAYFGENRNIQGMSPETPLTDPDSPENKQMLRAPAKREENVLVIRPTLSVISLLKKEPPVLSSPTIPN